MRHTATKKHSHHARLKASGETTHNIERERGLENESLSVIEWLQKQVRQEPCGEARDQVTANEQHNAPQTQKLEHCETERVAAPERTGACCPQTATTLQLAKQESSGAKGTHTAKKSCTRRSTRVTFGSASDTDDRHRDDEAAQQPYRRPTRRK